MCVFTRCAQAAPQSSDSADPLMTRAATGLGSRCGALVLAWGRLGYFFLAFFAFLGAAALAFLAFFAIRMLQPCLRR